jgi:glycosyltransferase involved in cell wall biosynthesis
MGGKEVVHSKTVLWTLEPTPHQFGEMPKVSVVMSVYNGARFLRQAVDSILAQTLADFEFIVVDDGSTDGTAEILKGYTDPRVRMITQANVGLLGSLNRAIDIASGEYIARMDADDISSPPRLELQLEWLESHPRTAVLGTQVAQIDEAGDAIRRHYHPRSTDAIEKALLRGTTALSHGSVMFRRACFESVGGYRQPFEHAEDYDLWLRMIESHDIWNLPSVLYLKRLNLDSVSFANFLAQQRGAAYALDCARHRRAGLPEPDRPPSAALPTPQESADYHWHLGLAYADLGHIGNARTHFRSAVCHCNTDPRIWFSYLASLLGKSPTRRALGFARKVAFLVPSLQKNPLGPFSR